MDNRAAIKSKRGFRQSLSKGAMRMSFYKVAKPEEEEQAVEAGDALNTSLDSISKSLFQNDKKDSPKKRFTRRNNSSPTSVAKALLSNAIDQFDNLSPNSLFKLLKDLKWKSAASRSVEFPEEPCRWVVKYDERNIKMLWKRLPIHEACIRQPTPEVVAALLDANPSGASAKDNQGRTPLHYAVIHGAHIDVVHLLMHAAYDVATEKDFFYKLPKDYAHTTTFTHKTEVIAALTLKSRQDVASAASGVRVLLQKSHPTHGAGMGASREFISDPVEEQLAQALAEADAANTISEVARANEEVFRVQIRELKEKIIGMQKQLKEEEQGRERHENCIFLLERKQQTLVTALAKKDTDIDSLQNRIKDDKKLRQSEAAMRNKLKHSVSCLTEKLNSSGIETDYWKEEAAKIATAKNEVETKNKSLEELLKVYHDRSQEFEAKFNEVKVYMTNAENATMQSSDVVTGMAEKVAISKSEKDNLKQELVEAKSVSTDHSNKVAILEQLLTTAEDERIELEYHCEDLEENLVHSNEEVKAHKAIVKGYHEKVTRLEEAFNQVSRHLVERTIDLSEAKITAEELEAEIVAIRKEHNDAKDGDTSRANAEIDALLNDHEKALENIEELRSLIVEYDESNEDMMQRCAEYENKVKLLNELSEEEESKIEDLEQIVHSLEDNNRKLESKYSQCKLKLHVCKEEHSKQIAYLEKVVKGLREEAFDAALHFEKEKKQLKHELRKKKDIQWNPGRDVEDRAAWGFPANNADNKKTTRDTSTQRVRWQSRRTLAGDSQAPRGYRPDGLDDSDNRSVATSISMRSINSAASASSSRSTNSAGNAYSTRSSLALRTQRALKHRIPSRSRSLNESL